MIDLLLDGLSFCLIFQFYFCFPFSFLFCFVCSSPHFPCFSVLSRVFLQTSFCFENSSSFNIAFLAFQQTKQRRKNIKKKKETEEEKKLLCVAVSVWFVFCQTFSRKMQKIKFEETRFFSFVQHQPKTTKKNKNQQNIYIMLAKTLIAAGFCWS